MNFLADDSGHVHLASSRACIHSSHQKQYFYIRDLQVVEPRSSSHCSSPLCIPSIPAAMELTVWKVTTAESPIIMEIKLLKSWMTKKLYFISQHVHEIFSTKAPNTISGAHPPIPLFSGCYEPPISGAKHLWPEADHSPARTAITNGQRYSFSPTHPYALML